jgi:iron(II)-dependent oxidoreductase
MGLSGIYEWVANNVGRSARSGNRDASPNGRFALFLRPQIANSLIDGDVCRLYSQLDSKMLLVRSGKVCIRTEEAYGNSGAWEEMNWTIEVGEFLLDRFAVTNEQYFEFIADGGYRDDAWWHEAALPLRDGWVDRSGKPGPMQWCQGIPPRNLVEHPVVGISWFEADAFARWSGKRLPSEAEWMRGGLADDDGTRVYPWGSKWCHDGANSWHSGFDTTVPVASLPPDKDAPEIFQLIGNTWEWTQTTYGCWTSSDTSKELSGFRAIKGGAFDTMLASQASLRFQSGESPVNRRNNIGFRCALNPADIVARPV